MSGKEHGEKPHERYQNENKRIQRVDDEFDAVRRSISAYLIMDRSALHYCDELHHGQRKRGQHRKAHSKSAEMLVDPGQQQA